MIDDDNNWYNISFTDYSMSSDFNWIKASSELDAIDGFTYNFLVTTSPISITNLKTSYWQSSSYAQSVLQFNSSNNANYVSVSVSLSSSGFYAYLYAGY